MTHEQQAQYVIDMGLYSLGADHVRAKVSRIHEDLMRANDHLLNLAASTGDVVTIVSCMARATELVFMRDALLKALDSQSQPTVH